MKANNEIAAMQKVFEALSGLDVEEQRRILEWVINKLKLQVSSIANVQSAPKGNVLGSPPVPVHDAAQLNPKGFMAAKKPANLMERIACLAYLLTYQRQTPTFKTKDIEDMNKAAAMPKISGAAYKVRDATTHDQYLAQAGGGTKQITARGEAIVDALPDREKVGVALEAHPLTRRGKRKAKKAK